MKRRNTIQRKLVLDAVNELHDHASAEEIYEIIHAKNPSISKATVYRNLNLLAAFGEILKIEVPGNAERFDHNNINHGHIRCVQCKKLFDIDTGLLEDVKKKVGDGFEIKTMMLEGICKKCKKEKEKEHENI